MKFTKNTFIKWTGTDADGTFSHVGQVIKHTKGMITFATADGEITIADTDGEFTAARKPRTWNVKKPAAVKNEKPVTKTKRTRKAGGKTAEVVALIKEHKPATRKEAIALIVDAGISTPAGASTHYNNAKKLV